MSFEEAAGRLAVRVRAAGKGFLTLRREELREAFAIGKLTQNQSDLIVEALKSVGLQILPHPLDAGSTLRLFDERHPLGEIANTIANPDETTEAPLRRAAETFARERAGKDMRSDDVPWLEGFDMLLQLASGREPEGWEDLRDDRHPSMLAREIAESLGLQPAHAEASWMLKLASAVCCHRPRARHWRVAEFVGDVDAAQYANDIHDALVARDRRLREDFEKLLRAAARLALHGREVPDAQVELGLMRLRRRREDNS